MVDVAGFLEALRDRSQQQTVTLQEAHGTSKQVLQANEAVVQSVKEVTEAADHTLEMAVSSVASVRESAQRSSQVAGWVASISGQVQGVKTSLSQVETNTRLIEDIAFQVDILSVNARIEASRAGEAGKGFAVIAHAINELSSRTNEAAKDISASVRSLNEQIAVLVEESAAVRGKAEQVISDNQKTDTSLTQISNDIRGVHENARKIDKEAQNVNRATTSFVPAFRNVGDSITDTTKRIQGAMARVESLIDKTEQIVQMSTSLGGKVADAQFIERVIADAEQLSEALSLAVANGQITEKALFSRSYTPIPNSNPAQVMAPFTRLTDQLFPTVQEKALTLSEKVVFCAAVNRDGYLPTHNRKFSKPQGRDVDWNTANCRNRRIFDDRVGLKAGRNTEAFLLQVYRRDMGAGEFKLMKDVSAPIRVNGRHWGGLRLAFDV
ncbi:methyl-accepting chemotaxis protein [Seohaeicola saemankumensis]|nr:methyl-accepting chemotaxis protein [Seohaeicola saemankumensis]MCA0872416.1 methyl-accepting chemotaxis protein [Seohaeicola saemankumensis]